MQGMELDEEIEMAGLGRGGRGGRRDRGGTMRKKWKGGRRVGGKGRGGESDIFGWNRSDSSNVSGGIR